MFWRKIGTQSHSAKFLNWGDRDCDFRAEKRSAQASAHPLSQAQGGLFCVLTVQFAQFVCLSLREF